MKDEKDAVMLILGARYLLIHVFRCSCFACYSCKHANISDLVRLYVVAHGVCDAAVIPRHDAGRAIDTGSRVHVQRRIVFVVSLMHEICERNNATADSIHVPRNVLAA